MAKTTFSVEEAKTLIAEALTEREGKIYRPSDITFDIGMGTVGYGMGERQDAVLSGVTATFRPPPMRATTTGRIQSATPNQANGPRSESHPRAGQRCLECSTRRLDENGDCSSCDR